MSRSDTIEKFIKKFKASVVIPDDGKVCQLDVGHHRIAIASSIRSLPPGTEFVLRTKNVEEVLKRDIWDVPLLLDAELIEEQFSRATPEGATRPKGGKSKIIYPTGILPIDIALVSGGFHSRIISRIWGASEGGKSIILYMTMITAWNLFRKRSLLVNPEFDFNEDRFCALPGGKDVLDADALEIYEPGTGTDAYDELLDKIATGSFGIAGIDSISPLKASDEADKRMKDTEKVAAKATIQSRFLDSVMPILYHQANTALIVVAQSRRQIMGAGFGSFDSVSGSYVGGGGKQAASDALQFDCQQSLKINAASKAKYDSNKNMIGHLCTGFVDKNKRAAKGRRFEFMIDYYNGLDLETQILNESIRTEVISVNKNSLSFGDIKFTNSKAFRKELQQNKELRLKVYSAVLMKINSDFAL